MENKNQQNSNQQNFDNFSDAASKQTNTPGTNSSISDEDIEPVLDEQDMEENHLKEEDLDNIVWDKPAQPDKELSTSTSEKDITD